MLSVPTAVADIDAPVQPAVSSLTLSAPRDTAVAAEPSDLDPPAFPLHPDARQWRRSDLADTRDLSAAHLDGAAKATQETPIAQLITPPPPPPLQDDVEMMMNSVSLYRPQEGESGGHDNESSTEGESGGGDIAASFTEDDIARDDMTAVEDRRFLEAQPETRTVGDLHPCRPPADRNVQPGVSNVALMIGNWGMRGEKAKGSSVAKVKRMIVKFWGALR